MHCFYVLTREVYIPDENTGNIYKSYCLDMIVPSSGDGKYAAIKMYDEKQKGAAIVVEATIAENPMYDPNSKSDIQEQKYVPVFRQIPIRKRASTVQKEKQISLISKIISEKMPQDMLDAFEQKTKELSDILDSFNKYLSLEVRKQLITAYQDLNRKKDLSLKQVKEPKKQNSNNTNKNGNTKTV